jgi:hypothetical protein
MSGKLDFCFYGGALKKWDSCGDKYQYLVVGINSLKV